MTQKNQLIFLGTGGSMGVPVIGCSCPVCQSADPHNKRLRSSALLNIENKKILIDCGPDFRAQALKYQIDDLDGVILTHAHYDHTAGLDELRIYSLRHKKSLPCLMSAETADDVQKRFYYVFDSKKDHTLKPRLALQLLEGLRGETHFFGVPIKFVTYEQGGMRVNGLRIGNLAYISDIHIYPETIFEDLAGVEILVISALRHAVSDLHFTVDQAVQFSQKVGARSTWLTHIAHELDHSQTNGNLPPNVQMSYDGLKIDFEGVSHG